MMSPKISVIIPVYNAEAYLEKCVDSVRELPFETEMILIDDGSRDKSGEICDAIAARYEKIKVVHQENQGVSAARNRGLEIARGEYVWFVDADDSVAKTQQAQSSKSKAICHAAHVQEKREGQSSKLVLLPFIWDEDGIARHYDAHTDEIPYNLWRCWFERKEIERQKLRFTVGRKYAEDQEFILKFLLGCRKAPKNIIFAADYPKYYYTLRPGSAMTKSGVKRKKMADLSAVLSSFFWNALCSGAIFQGWTLKEMKRLAKNLYVTICRI